MSLAYFLHVDGPEAGLADFQAWAEESFGAAVHRADADSCVEAFAPRSVDDPYLGKEAGKLLIVVVTLMLHP